MRAPVSSLTKSSAFLTEATLTQRHADRMPGPENPCTDLPLFWGQLDPWFPLLLAILSFYYINTAFTKT